MAEGRKSEGATAAEQANKFQPTLKDILYFFIPLIASGLAVTSEVGFFQKIGGAAFTFFSLTEHIAFAVQALPQALVLAGMLLAGAFQWDLMNKYVGPVMSAQSTSRRRRIVQTSNQLGLITFRALTVYEFDHPSTALLFAITFIAAATLAGFFISRTVMVRAVVVGSIGILSGFFIAFSLGFDSAQHEIKSNRPLSSISTGEKAKSAETQIKVRVLRSGERGVLYFDTTTRAFGFLPWENIKQIDWQISCAPVIRKSTQLFV